LNTIILKNIIQLKPRSLSIYQNRAVYYWWWRL